MNKIVSLLFLALFLVQPHTIQAHVLETSGEIGAVLHIDPDDDPYAKIPSQIYFDIKDKTNRFAYSDCECVFNVYSNEKLIHSQKALTETVTYTFPEKGVYRISLSGKPSQSANFSNFNLTYDIRVSREPDQIQSQSKNYLPIVFSTLFLSVFVLLILKFKNKGLSIIIVFGLSINLLAHIITHHHDSNVFSKSQDCCLINQVVAEIESPRLSIPYEYYEPKSIQSTFAPPKQYLSLKTSRSPPWN